jgi:hypothetical protein
VNGGGYIQFLGYNKGHKRFMFLCDCWNGIEVVDVVR